MNPIVVKGPDGTVSLGTESRDKNSVSPSPSLIIFVERGIVLELQFLFDLQEWRKEGPLLWMPENKRHGD